MEGWPAGHVVEGWPAGHVVEGWPAGHVVEGWPAGHVVEGWPAGHVVEGWRAGHVVEGWPAGHQKHGLCFVEKWPAGLSVPGKPVMCLVNLCPQRRLVNGTLMIEDEIIVKNEKTKEELSSYIKENGRPGKILDCTAFSIAGISASTVDGNLSAEFRKSDIDDELEIGSLTPFTKYRELLLQKMSAQT